MEAVCSSRARSSEAMLPPGFRFHPTDEELIECYLIKKVQNNSFSVRAIGDVDLNKNEPWELPEKAKMGEKEWYFFTLRDRKYPTGMRTNRATEAGYWKATGKDRDINRSSNSALVGAKKTLVFYRGRAPKGVKTNWIMHEYRLEGEAAYLHNSRTSKDSEWVVCRIFEKNPGGKKGVYRESSHSSLTRDMKSSSSGGATTSTSAGKLCLDHSEIDHSSSLPPLLESPHLDCPGDDNTSSLLKHISLPLPPSTTNTFLKFPNMIYDQHHGCFEEDRPNSANLACKMEPSSSYHHHQHQHQHQHPHPHQQQVLNGISWNLQDSQAYNLPGSAAGGAANVCETPGLTEILESSTNASASYYRAVASLSSSASAVDLESLWNY